MKKGYQHWEHCNAPICVGDQTEDWQSNVIWYPGEAVCLRNPLSTAQKAQKKINRMVAKGRFKHIDRAFTYAMLSSLPVIRTGLKGLNPEKPTLLKRFNQTS